MRHYVEVEKEIGVEERGGAEDGSKGSSNEGDL